MSDTEIVDRLQEMLDPETATLIAADDPMDCRFIGEAMLAAVAIVLLEQYASGFLEGIGLKEKAKQQGKKARDWLSRLRTGALTNDELDAARGDAADAVASIRSEKANAAGITSGERATQEFLKEVGAPPSRARALAAELTALVTGDDRDHGTSG